MDHFEVFGLPRRLGIDAAELQRWLPEALRTAEGSIRAQLKRYAEDHAVEI